MVQQTDYWDLAYGRSGTLMNFMPSGVRDRVNIVYRPLNSLKTVIIKNVIPPIFIPPFGADMPKRGLWISVLGENDQAPLLNDYLKGKVGELNAQLFDMIKRLEMQASTAELESDVLALGVDVKLEAEKQKSLERDRQRRFPRRPGPDYEDYYG